MVLADDKISIAGPPDVIDEEETLAAVDQKATQKQLARQVKVYEGSEGASLSAVSTGGTKLGERKLDEVSVFDGMAAANGRLYMATIEGNVLCLAGR